jgi:hypothetical protein
MTRGMANNTMTESVAESVAPVAPAGPVAPVALVKKGKINMLDLGHVLRGLQLCMLERDDVVYMKASWVIVFFYECHTDCVEHIMKDLRDTKELSQEIVTLKVGKYEGEWFTLAGAKMVLGMVPYQMTRKERAEVAEEFKKFEKVKPAGEGKAGEARVAPEVVKLNDGQPLLHPFSPARDRPLATVLVFPRASAIPAATRTSRRHGHGVLSATNYESPSSSWLRFRLAPSSHGGPAAVTVHPPPLSLAFPPLPDSAIATRPEPLPGIPLGHTDYPVTRTLTSE